MNLKQKCILTLVSFFHNVRVGVWGERGEQWSFAILSLVVFIFNGKLPLLWLVKILGFGLVFSGLGLFSSGILELGECISPFIAPVTIGGGFKQDGPYRMTRHPIYGGVVLFFSGMSLITNSLDRAILTFILGIIMNQAASVEESLLRDVHGSSYDDYAFGRCKMIPFLF